MSTRYQHHHRRTRRTRTASKRPSYWATQSKNQSQQPANPLDNNHVRAALSPLFFAIAFLNFTPEPAQAHVLKTAHFFKRIALNCNRQWGKSTIAAILITHRLFTQPNSLVIIVAPAGRQAGETFLKVKDFLNDLGIRTKTDGINPTSLVLPNGARLVSLAGVDRTARGFSAVSLILFDEASGIKDRIYLAFRPMLAVSQGDLIISSTPHGRRGFFFREMAGQDKTAHQWFRHTGPVTECIPRISPEFIAEEQAKGDSYFNQEWLCQFVETALYVLDEATVHKMIKDSVEAYRWL